jgi:hypothetical protein
MTIKRDDNEHIFLRQEVAVKRGYLPTNQIGATVTTSKITRATVTNPVDGFNDYIRWQIQRWHWRNIHSEKINPSKSTTAVYLWLLCAPFDRPQSAHVADPSKDLEMSKPLLTQKVARSFINQEPGDCLHLSQFKILPIPQTVPYTLSSKSPEYILLAMKSRSIDRGEKTSFLFDASCLWSPLSITASHSFWIRCWNQA